MNQQNKKSKKWAWLLCLTLLFALLAPAGFLRAAEEFKLKETKLTLYPGNTYQLEYSGTQEHEGEEWEWMFDRPYFISSDTSVAVVDYYGLVRAVGVGTATITANYNGQQAACTVKVRKNSCELDAETLVLYQGQEAVVTLTSKKKAKGYSYYICGADEDTWADEYDLSPESLGKGQFRLHANAVGRYYVDFVIRATDGKDYSARCEVEVRPCGLQSSYIAVAEGKKTQIVLDNALFLSCETEPEEEKRGGTEEESTENSGIEWENMESKATGESGEEDLDLYSTRAEVAVNKKGVISGKKAGNIKLFVSYETAYHEMRTETLYVHVTKPNYLPFESYLWAGDSYAPQFSGISPYSEITVSAEDENVIQTEKWGNNVYLFPKEGGSTTITVTADGVSFTQKVTVINPTLTAYNMALEKGKTKKLGVAGAPEDCKITYSSSDKTVAAVTKAGKITTKKKGSALITVTVDGRKMYCTVSVGAGKGLKAVQKAEAVLGAAYSQEKRMQKGYYDCSSLVWRSYNEAGLALAGMSYAPTAADLAKKLEAEGKAIAYEYVSPDELQPGDIIFYRGTGNGRYKDIDHAALYYGANYEPGWWYDGELYNTGMIIHASSNVQMRTYEYYRTDSIVMIARPVQ